MKTKRIWAIAVVVLVSGMVALKAYRVSPKPLPVEQRLQILEEISAADAGITTLMPGALMPDHSGATLAYIHLTDAELTGFDDSGFVVSVVNLKTLENRQLPKTNLVRYVFGWSSDDRYLAFSQNHGRPKSADGKTPQFIEEWLSLYDCQAGVTRRLTAATNVKEQEFHWLTQDSFLLAVVQGISARARFYLGSLPGATLEKVSDFTEKMTVLSARTVAFTKNNDLYTLELKPLRGAEAGWDGGSNGVQKISDFKTNEFSGLQWVNYSAARSNFLFCSRPKGSSWRYLYEYDPASQKLTQLSHEDTYNGQWLLQGAGYAYVINTNNSFQLAVRTFSGVGNTNLFTAGNLVAYRASPYGDRIYAVGSLQGEPHGIWEYTLTNQCLRKVVEGTARPWAASQVARLEEFSLKSFDGVKTPCFLFTPVRQPGLAAKSILDRLRPRVKHPAVIHIPATTYQFQRRFDHQAQVFANLGFYFAAINYRGCDGYGAEYSSLANTQAAARDVLNLYDKLAANPEVDARNIFITTTSGGMGVVAELLATHPELWAGVAVDKAGAIQTNPCYDLGRLPPLLMIVGGQDPLVNREAMASFIAWASSNRVELRTVIHTNSGHLTRSLVDRKDVLQQMAEFFIGHLK